MEHDRRLLIDEQRGNETLGARVRGPSSQFFSFLRAVPFERARELCRRGSPCACTSDHALLPEGVNLLTEARKLRLARTPLAEVICRDHVIHPKFPFCRRVVNEGALGYGSSAADLVS